MANEKQKQKQARQEQLAAEVRQNPFLTDDELAEMLNVSIQTIRLDRLALGIVEVRKRIQSVAERVHGNIRSLREGELVGQLLDLNLGESAISMLEITEDMVSEFDHVRGQLLFAQANSLALAVIDADVALTGSARVRFKRPVLLGETVIGKAVVKTRKSNSFLVSTYLKVDGEIVFKGHFIMFAQGSQQHKEDISQ